MNPDASQRVDGNGRNRTCRHDDFQSPALPTELRFLGWKCPTLDERALRLVEDSNPLSLPIWSACFIQVAAPVFPD